MTEEEVAAAEADGTLLGLAAERFLLPGERLYDLAQLAERTGARVEELRGLWLALGFAAASAQEKSYTDNDVAIIRTLIADGRTELSSEYTRHEARVISSSLARIAEVFVDELSDEYRFGGGSDMQALGAMAAIDVQRVEKLLLSLLRRHLVAAVYRRVALREQAQRAGQASLAVGFADLTGFVELSQGLTDEDLTRMIVAFERRAFDTVAEMGGRVVKTIGDAVMFTFEAAPTAADVALRLVDGDQDGGAGDGPPLRVGLAFGPVLARQGDCYGPTVNLASRIAGVTGAGEVIVDGAMASALASDPRFVLAAMGDVPLKGFGTVALTRVSQSAAGS